MLTKNTDDLLLRLDFRDPDPEIIDISPEGGVVSSLKESQINCLVTDKVCTAVGFVASFLTSRTGCLPVLLPDALPWTLPHILLFHRRNPAHHAPHEPARCARLPAALAAGAETALEESRQVCPILRSAVSVSLNRLCAPRFKTTANSILLATDIAARGLDVPAVDHVIHYQIPRSADVYVHRNGRTARAMRSGFSLLMCAPDERRLVRALLGSLGRRECSPSAQQPS